MVAVKGRVLSYTLFLISSLVLLGCSPYSSEFSCPNTYDGVCEPPTDAYNDSVNGIDPRKYDEKWQEKRKKWEEKNKALLEARARAMSGNVTGEAPGYRQALFRKMKEALERPETPVLVPPRIGRALVLGFSQGDLFVAPHYIFFTMDKPRWTFRKVQERVRPKPPPSKDEANQIQEVEEEVAF